MDKFNAHWDKLKVFYQIAKIGSFSAAAEVLNISQPALSRQISLLESRIQTRLFERVPHGLILTRQGEILFQAIQKMSSELAQAQISLEEEENEPVGLLRVGATAGFASLHLATLIPDFLRLYPKIQISIYGSDVIPELHSDEVDIAITPFIGSDESLIQTYLTTFHLRLYASQTYLEKVGIPKKASDLDHHQLLAYGDHKTLHPFSQANWHLKMGAKPDTLRQPYIMINSAMGLFNLALGDMGIISLSREHPQLQNSSLIEVLPSLEGPTIDAYFIHSARTKKIKRIALLKEFLLKKFKNNLHKNLESPNIQIKMM